MPSATPEPDDDEHLHEQRRDERRRAGADRAQQRERARLLQRDDQEEQPGDERDDEPVEQEDDQERLAHLRHAGRLGRGVAPGQRLEVGADRVDASDELLGRDARRGRDTERVRQRRPRVGVRGTHRVLPGVVADEHRRRCLQVGVARLADDADLVAAGLDPHDVADAEALRRVGLVGDALAGGRRVAARDERLRRAERPLLVADDRGAR